MTPQEGSLLLKSCARRSFSFTHGNLQALATHPHSLGDPLLGRDPWFEKHRIKIQDDRHLPAVFCTFRRMIQNSYSSFLRRCELCVELNGGHLEQNLLFYHILIHLYQDLFYYINCNEGYLFSFMIVKRRENRDHPVYEMRKKNLISQEN